MFQFTSPRCLALAAALFAATGTTAAMAQSANTTVGNSSAGTYSGPTTHGSPAPISATVGADHYYGAAATGKGTFVGAGSVNSSGHVNEVYVGTNAVGHGCPTLPGVDAAVEGCK